MEAERRPGRRQSGTYRERVRRRLSLVCICGHIHNYLLLNRPDYRVPVSRTDDLTSYITARLDN